MMASSVDSLQNGALGRSSNASANGHADGSNMSSIDSAYSATGRYDADDGARPSGSSSTGSLLSPRRQRAADSSITSPLQSIANTRGPALKARHTNGSIDGSNGQARPAGEPSDDLWGSILNSVQTSRATPTKNVVILGEPRTGKSTLLSQLAATAPVAFVSHHAEQSDGSSSSYARPVASGLPRSESTAQVPSGSAAASSADIGLSYSYFDIGDADGEDTIGRVGAYQISSSNPSNIALLPFALSSADRDEAQDINAGRPTNRAGSTFRTPKSSSAQSSKVQLNTSPRPGVDALRDSLFVIVLDWEAPWTFLHQLVQWLDVIREITENASGSEAKHSERAAMDELRADLEQYIRAYTEPAVANPADVIEIDGEDVGDITTASAVVAVSNPTGVDGIDASPLPEGSLTHNLGVPIVVVCTKADAMQQLEKQRSFKEERFDYIQQVLRTVCLKYGAGLFFTTHTRPASFDVIREYVFHRLFASSRQQSATETFKFTHRASTVERDVLVVPAGWDSFGKIRALRDGFDCASMAAGWERDAAVERVRRAKGLPKGAREAEEAAEQMNDRRSLSGPGSSDGGGIVSAIRLYEDIVEDWDASVAHLATDPNTVKEPDAQAFLAQYHSSLQREPDTRGKMNRQTSSGNLSDVDASSSSRTGVVGPMGSSSLSLPSVERAMMERLQDDGRPSKSSSRRGEGREHHRGADTGRSTPTHQNLQSPSLQSDRATSPLGPGPASPSPSAGAAAAAAAASGGAQTPKQSEVLHSFFQSLLKDKAPPGSGSGGSGTSSRGGAARGERR